MLYRIIGKTTRGMPFCACIGDGMCAPILKFMKGWTLRRIKALCAQRGWTIDIVPDRIAEMTGRPTPPLSPKERERIEGGLTDVRDESHRLRETIESRKRQS